jgi:hypothetical protein
VLELEIHRFDGTDPGFVLILAGIHSSEQSGVEVARWLVTKLAAKEKPTRLGAVVIPDVYPARGIAARTDEYPKTDITYMWRDIDAATRKKTKSKARASSATQVISTARQFPPPGRPLSYLAKGFLRDEAGTDLNVEGKVPLQPEIEYLIRLIEALKPVRIVSIHGKRPRTKKDLAGAVRDTVITMTKDEIEKWDGRAIKGVNFAGIYVDPRYDASSVCKEKGSLEACKFDLDLDPAFPTRGKAKRFDSARKDIGRRDDDLCLKFAKAVADKSLVPGNHRDDPIPVVHYAKEGGTSPGFSLGDWGPVDVEPGKKTPGSRKGAPVFTIEVKENHESWAFFDEVQTVTEGGEPLPRPATPPERAGKKKPPPISNPEFARDRSKALQAYADSIIATVLQLED